MAEPRYDLILRRGQHEADAKPEEEYGVNKTADEVREIVAHELRDLDGFGFRDIVIIKRD